MSEQPTSNVYDLSQRRYKADGSLEMGPETDVLLHASNLPHKPTESGKDTLTDMRTTAVEINPEIQAIRDVAQLISNLDAVRRHEAA